MNHAFQALPWSILIYWMVNLCNCHSFLDSTSPFSSYQGLSCYPTSPAINLTTFGSSNSTVSTVSTVSEINGSDISESDINESNTTTIEDQVIEPDISKDQETDELDDTSDKFLSFEEWRKLNLERSGQTNPPQVHHPEPNRDFPQDYMGDDDIDMNLDVFGPKPEPKTVENRTVDDDTLSKTYKNRFNYASFDCAATIVKSNANMKGASNVLNENKDTYLNNECQEQNKFLIIELCQDILVDTLVVANFEFFSSMFRKFRISVSDRFPAPASDWKILGEFEAQSVRDLQSFHVESPLIWARYLQIEFLTHWGHEFYCPVSLVRVHGTTMMEEYKNQESYAKGEVSTTTMSIKTEQPTETDSYPSSYTMQADLLMDKMDYLVPSDLETRTHSPTKSDSAPPFETSTLSTDLLCMKNMDPDFFDKMSLSPLILDDSCHWDEYSSIESSTSNTITSETVQTFASYSTGISSASSIPDIDNSTVKPTQTAPESRTQDSIYQTIMKRLSLLESNTTLSMKYVENQSQNLRELLSKIEKKQNSKIEAFFDEFNNTIVSQLQEFQNQYSNLVISVINDLNAERSLNVRDISALSSRLAILADDLMYQRRISMVQGIILLIVMLFVIATRGTLTENYTLSRAKRFTKLWELGTPFDSSPSLRASDDSEFSDDEIYYDNGGFISQKSRIGRQLPTFSSSNRRCSTETDKTSAYLSPNDTDDDQTKK